jgi:hypothetical protein
VKSYRDLPRNLYHIQWKFRDEVRPRFGVMRGREFLMKDAYSFDLDKAGAIRSYNKMFVAYLRTFARMGLKAIPMRADTGPIGGDLSHEFIILADTGESAVFCDKGLIDKDILGRSDRLRRRPAADSQRMDVALRRTDEMHDAARFETEVPADRRIVGARHRGRPHLLFRHPVLQAAQRRGRRPQRREHRRRDGLLRRRRLAPDGRDHRGQPRRQRHHLARSGGAVQGRPDQPQARRRARLRRCKTLYDKLARGRVETLYDDSRRARRRQVRRHGPDRPALAGHHRPQGRRGRQGRGQEPQDRPREEMAPEALLARFGA